MTAVIYARYSTDSQREESIEGQIRECTAYAEKNGFTVVKHYIDRAVSAKTDNRPQFQQMIKDSERGIFDVIIVWKLDRFARNRYDSARYKTQLKRNGVKLVSATEVISAGPEGIILESVLEGYAEYYSADLSEKVVRGMTENALKGIYNGGTIPFGYMIDETRHYQPDPLLAPYVEQTFQKYADGATMTDLRDWLKAHNIKNSMGGEMSYNTIQRMLSNRRYIGELRLRDVVQPNAIPALVSEELFNKVQKKLAKNKKAPARHKAEEIYLLTTKLYCGKCGALMFGESGVSHTGKMYTYYKCAAAKKKKTCDKKAVRKQWLEDLVVNETMKLVEDDASMNAIIAKVILVALLSVWVSSLFHDAVNKLVWCLIFGVLCKELGFLDEDALGKAHATGIVMPIITLSIFTNLASATPEMVGGMVWPLVVCVVIGTIAFSAVSILVGKIFGYSWQMSMAIGSSCLFGFPGTVIISNEVSESTGTTAQEKAAINAEIMPKMLVAGMVTVSITSVLVAGVMSAWL